MKAKLTLATLLALASLSKPAEALYHCMFIWCVPTTPAPHVARQHKGRHGKIKDPLPENIDEFCQKVNHAFKNFSIVDLDRFIHSIPRDRLNDVGQCAPNER